MPSRAVSAAANTGPPTTAPSNVAVVTTAVLSTVSSVYPAFLVGGLGVQLREELDLTEGLFGILFGSFFFGAMIASMAGGRMVERIGARRALIGGILSIIALDLVVAAFVRDARWIFFLVVLFLLGIANAVNQTAANKLLSQSANRERLALAIAIKQSAMPSSTLLAGLAVPVLALTLGWQAAYVSAALVATVALILVLRFAPMQAPGAAVIGQPTTPLPTLRFTAVGAAFAAAVAGAVSGWTVSSATAAGIAEGAAGLLLSFGSLAGITVRLTVGARADRSERRPMAGAGILLLLGSAGIFILSLHTHWAHIAGVALGFGAGWAWPALFNYAIIRANESAPSAATGVTQTGVYVGVLTGPILVGFVVEQFGYRWAWALVGSWAIIGGLILLRLADDFESR